jgi:serine protease inhibitor ecotin
MVPCPTEEAKTERVRTTVNNDRNCRCNACLSLIVVATYRMRHEIQVWKSGSKVRSIDIRLPGTLGEKETVAAGTKDVDGIISG